MQPPDDPVHSKNGGVYTDDGVAGFRLPLSVVVDTSLLFTRGGH